MSGTGLNAMENLVRAGPWPQGAHCLKERPVRKQDESGRKMGRGRRKVQRGSPVGKRNSNPRMQLMNYFVTLFS